MLLHLVDRRIVVTLFCLAAACASGGSRANGYVAPDMRSRTAPNLSSVPMEGPSNRPTLSFSVEVMIDSAGSPMMDTFKVSGPLTTQDMQAVRDWIQQSAFKPATQDGKPVQGLFRISMSAGMRRVTME